MPYEYILEKWLKTLDVLVDIETKSKMSMIKQNFVLF